MQRPLMGKGPVSEMGSKRILIIPSDMPSDGRFRLLNPGLLAHCFRPHSWHSFLGLQPRPLPSPTVTLTARTASEARAALARSLISPSRNRICAPHAAEEARITSTPASRPAGAHSMARRSPTTPSHRRPSSPRAMPAAQGRPAASASSTDPSTSGSLARPLFHQLRELPRDNPALLGAPHRRSGWDVPFFRDRDENLPPPIQR